MKKFTHHNTGDEKKLTSDTGTNISNNRWSLRAGKRGPTLLQDFHFYRKQSHFNRERIPEKVVHARGDGVYGEFTCYRSLSNLTTAHFLQEAGRKTPVFVRFSNFIGSKGSKDTAIDIRGFATKFYTEEGNYDMLALSFAVFSILDAMKFADFVHAVKPNPQTDVPQATVAHDNAWDYISKNEEIAHFVMWLMSDRGRPRSWRMMEGWPINTFRLINRDGVSTFVRFVWKPLLGVHSLLLDEANIIGGVDPDYHRRDLHEAIERGAYPKYELGIQCIEEGDQFNYDFDILDDTKFWPEEIIPVEIIGKMTLNRLVDNHFAEEEQVSFDPSTLIPGIDVTNDPVLQGRTFAYRDTDYHRLGTGNINDIPINRPINDVHYNQRDSFSRYRIDADSVNYKENMLANNTPLVTPVEEGGYGTYPEKVTGEVTREMPSDLFNDFYSQARLFWNSMSPIEKSNIIDTFIFHLGYVKSKEVRQNVVDMFAHVDEEMSAIIAAHIGVQKSTNQQVNVSESSPAVSLANTAHLPNTQRVAVLVADGFSGNEVAETIQVLEKHGVFVDFIGNSLGTVQGSDDVEMVTNKLFQATYPVLYDALYIIGGEELTPIVLREINAYFTAMYKQYKPIGIANGAETFLDVPSNAPGIIFASDEEDFANAFVEAIAMQRFWNRSV
ncbi:catalase [Pseudogracilibacillus sp. ICA-222130]